MTSHPLRTTRTTHRRVCLATLTILVYVVLGAVRGAAATRTGTWRAEELVAAAPHAPHATPAGRRNAFLAYDGVHDVAVLFGGLARNGDGVRVSLRDTWLFHVNETRWERVDDGTGGAVAPPARHAGVCAFDDVGGRFLVATGETRHADGRPRDFWADVWAFDVATRTWSELATSGTAPSPRYGSAGGVFTCPPWAVESEAPVCAPGGKLYVSHGFKSKRYDDTYTLDLATLTWSEVTPPASMPYRSYLHIPRRRCLVAGALRAPERMVMFGGCASGEGPCPLRDTWEFERDAWHNMGNTIAPFLQGRPTGRQHPALTAFVTEPIGTGEAVTHAHVGTLMFGGDDSAKKLGDFAVLPADATEWQQVSMDATASTVDVGARTAAMLVTTRLDGSFLLFGGEDSAGELPGNTIAIHAPSPTALEQSYTAYGAGGVGLFAVAIALPFVVTCVWLLLQWARARVGGGVGSFAQAMHVRLALRGVRGVSVGELLAISLYTLHVVLFMAVYGADAESEAFARAVGIANAINLAYLIIPVTRHSFLLHAFGTSLERALCFHRILARVTVTLITVHLGAMMATFGGKVFTASKFANVPLFGVLAWVVMLIMCACAYEPVRRKHFEWFYPYTHALYVLATIFVLLHSLRTLIAMSLPLALLLIDQTSRLWRSRGSQWKVEAAQVHGSAPSRVTRLQIVSTAAPMRYEAGQFVFLAVHGLSRVHFHPFSISCAPGHATSGGGHAFTLHIKDMGPGTFTHALADRVADAGASGLGGVSVEGPHGHLTVPLFGNDAPDAALLVAGGIGITPMVALWQALCQSTRSRPRVATLVWTVRTAADAELFLATLRSATANAAGTCALRVVVHMTREQGATDEGGGGVQVVAGQRPDLSRVLQSLRAGDSSVETTSMLACGPPPMVASAQALAAAHADVFFHKEVFLF